MDILRILQLLALLALANGTPILVNRVLGGRWALPVDGGLTFIDGWPLLGSSKTWRGVATSLLVTSLAASTIRLGATLGLVVAAGAMLGDMLSSFSKRRMHLPAGSRATGLDQIPESLIPLLLCWRLIDLSVAEILVIVAVFMVGEMLSSIVFYRLHLRERPY